jgi:hypothetical protein
MGGYTAGNGLMGLIEVFVDNSKSVKNIFQKRKLRGFPVDLLIVTVHLAI